MADRGRGRGRGQRGWRGRGRDRAGASKIGDASSTVRVCYEFKNNGKCKRYNCRFSHDLGNGKAAPQKTGAARVAETVEQRQARQSYSEWKRYLGSEPNDSRNMQRLWEGALQILEDEDRDQKQRLPQDLDTDDKNHKGRQHINALMSKRVRDGASTQFIENCRRFLLTITHPSLLDSLAVDTYVGSIYNFISGANGTRVVPYLQHLCETLIAARTEVCSPTSAEMLDSTLVAMSIALRELLKRESRARFNEDLQTLLDVMHIAADMCAPEKPSVTSTLVLNNVRCVRDMVTRANGLLSSNTTDLDNNSSQHVQASSYPRDLVIPSERHDNDKLDMTEIVIFPTRDEIMSNAKEFLPFTDPNHPHFLDDPAQRHIDTYFRLLRHDIFGELKGALANLMQALEQDKTIINGTNLPLGDVRAYHYTGARIRQVVFGRALDIHMSFLPPIAIRKKTVSAQEKWWEESKRLGAGSLLSFIWVQDEFVHHTFLILARKGAKDQNDDALEYDDDLVTVTARLMTQDKATLEMFMQASTSGSQGVLLEFPNVMPATFVPILETLQSMQSLGGMPFRQWIVPEKHDEPSGAKIYHNIPPPLYARSTRFTFPLKAITNGADSNLSIDATSSPNDKELLKKIESVASLDRGQCQALLAALTREFAFIQGPPGTGKSYLGLHLMRVLLEVKKKAKLGPVLVVCYTNHALDQFLEHLIKVGITKVIRVGGQSKSGILADHNLQNLKRSETNTRAEKTLAGQAYSDLDDCKTAANKLLDGLHHMHRMADWSNLKAHICREYRNIYCQFNEVDDEGFQIVGRHPFDIWANANIGAPTAYTQQPTTTIAHILQKATTNVYSLRHPERHALVSHWIQEIHEAKVWELFEVVDGAASTQRTLDNVHAESSRRVLQAADVIGLTTSGLAGRISLLKHVACKVMICEEAGEILEPHMISALLPTIEHCIQIGDHEQLRPTVSNFDELSLESERGKMHQLDKSQFERLSVGEARRPSVPIAQLNIQRRMRPEISTLIRETIYEKLLDHPSTVGLPDVVGIRQNVFWLDHTHLEDAGQMDVQHTRSKSNSWEVRMVHALVRHVVRQGTYKSSDIAVLTPYTGQLQKLRSSMRSDFEIVLSERDQEALENDGFKLEEPQPGEKRVAVTAEHGKQPLERKQLSELLRVATVDNFQGEEAKVVIISLVRSNKKRNVGFLKTTNRINVLLSRAKHGMFLIGNADTYSTVNMWQNVIGMMRANNSVGHSLGLCCPRHPDKIMDVHEPDDFAKVSPEGGCNETCIDRLDCGHSCRTKCHSKAMHAALQCEEPCQRRHQPCDHPCQKDTCGEPCGKCKTKIDNVQLPCGHVHNGVDCYLTLDLSNIPCHVQVSKQVPGCQHDVVVACSRDVTTTGFRCPTLCKSPLPCGHLCPGTCGRCNKGSGGSLPMGRGDTRSFSGGGMMPPPDTNSRFTMDDLRKLSKGASDRSLNTGAGLGHNKNTGAAVSHLTCTEKCRRNMGTCSHTCDRPCHDGTDCGLCQKPCEVRCKHSKCPHKCHDPCAPCSQNCEWFCEHQGKCTMPCSAPCNKLPCDERCAKLLPCGHQCPSICGEDCPIDCCQKCGMRKDENPDMIEMKPYSEVDLDESPIVALQCGHFFTLETLDGHIGLREVYGQDQATGRYVSLTENPQLAVKVPQCPNCRTPIRQYATQRYNRLINKAVIDETTKRFIVSGQQELQNLEGQLKMLDTDMETSRRSIIPGFTIPTADPNGRERLIEGAKYMLSQSTNTRYDKARQLEQRIKAFQKRTDTQHRPANKLRQAIVHAITKQRALDSTFADLSLDDPPTNAQYGGDQRIKHGGHLLLIKTQCLVLEDKFEIVSSTKPKFPVDVLPSNVLGSVLVTQASTYLNNCINAIYACNNDKLPRLAVELTLYHSRIARVLSSSGLVKDVDRKTVEAHREIAKELLGKAAKLCEQPFKDSITLSHAVEQSLRLLGKEFYAEVTKEEIEAIKAAMVSGRGGISTHSGHWYECANGHPFAIGECGMPMEQARCPECSAPVGGQNHQAVEGVSRAEYME